MDNIIVVTGQTATGKTKLALHLAKKHNGELINCDSRQIYQHLNIITGKDINLKTTKFTLKLKLGKFKIGYYPISTLNTKYLILDTRIWLYDIIDPKIPFSSFDWASCARIVIKDIIQRGKTPIIIGGTYLYLKHLLYGFETEKIPPNWTLRKQLNNYTVIKLQEKLIKVAPEVFQKLNQSDVANPQRLIRRIEIAYHKRINQKTENRSRKTEVGKQASEFSPQSSDFRHPLSDLSETSDFRTRYSDFIGLKYKDKNGLIKAITKRVHQRVKLGALDEVRLLLNKGYLSTDPGLKTIGYSQLTDHLSGKISLKKAINTWIIREIQYAKRQYTFMKKDCNIHWRMI